MFVSIISVFLILTMSFGNRVVFARQKEKPAHAAPMKNTEASQYDQYGGWTELRTKATGFFRTEKIDNTWWFITPKGNAFISKGVNHISFTGYHAKKLGYSPYGRTAIEKYHNANTWAEATVQRLRGWNFNTIGDWSSRETYTQGMPYTIGLGMGRAAGADWLRGVFPDVFTENFETGAEKIAKERCAPRVNDPYLLGYFLDNELRWGPNWEKHNPIFDDFFAMPADAPGKIALVNVLKDIYGGIDKMNSALHTNCSNFDDILAAKSLFELGDQMDALEQEIASDNSLGRFRLFPKPIAIGFLNNVYGGLVEVNKEFNTDAKSFDEFLTPIPLSLAAQEIRRVQGRFLKAVSERYFKVCEQAIRKYDSNHLILGCRYAGYAPVEVLEGMKDYVDVMSMNDYSVIPSRERFEGMYEITEKPFMITEFSFKAMDSGLPNTRGAAFPMETQQDRADAYAGFVETLMTMPFAIGFHWFEYTDDPPGGRSDGEDSNYGLVNSDDEPWEILTEKMTRVNIRLEQIHKED